MKLKLCNDETFQDSLSKVIPLKTFIEKIVQKIKNNSNEGNVDNKQSDNTQQMKEYGDVLKIGTLNELIESDLSKNKICEHLYKLLCDYFKNMNLKLKQMIEKHNGNIIEEMKGSEIDKFFKIKDTIENILNELSEENKTLKSNNKDNLLDIEVNKLKADIVSLNQIF